MTLNKEKKKKIAEKLLMSEEEYQEYLEKLKEEDKQISDTYKFSDTLITFNKKRNVLELITHKDKGKIKDTIELNQEFWGLISYILANSKYNTSKRIYINYKKYEWEHKSISRLDVIKLDGGASEYSHVFFVDSRGNEIGIYNQDFVEIEGGERFLVC